MDSDKDNMLKEDQDNIQASESTHQVKRYTTMNLYMWSEQNSQGKIRVTMLRQVRGSINTINMLMSPNKYRNEARKKLL